MPHDANFEYVIQVCYCNVQTSSRRLPTVGPTVSVHSGAFLFFKMIDTGLQAKDTFKVDASGEGRDG